MVLSPIGEKEKKFDSRAIPGRQPPPPSEFESHSGSKSSSEHFSICPQEKSSSVKRNTQQQVGGIEPSTKKRKAKPPKKSTPLDEPKGKKSSGDTKTGKEPIAENDDTFAVKKNGQPWNPKDEITFLRCLLACKVRDEIHGFLNMRTSFLNTSTSNNVLLSSEAMASTRDMVPLYSSEAERLEQEWHKQHLLELEVCSRRLALLQYECKLRIEKVRTLVNQENL